MPKTPDKNLSIAILGPTGDLGSHFANYLIQEQQKLLVVFRKGQLEKLKKRVRQSDKTVSIETATLFNQNLLYEVFKSSKIVFNFAGLVSLSFSEIAYPHIILINGFFPGLLVHFNKKYNVPIVYASTQRVNNMSKRQDIRQWVSSAINAFDGFIENDRIDSDLEGELLAFTKRFLSNHLIPSPVNIYDLSKVLGEEMLKRSNNSIILRVSSCYGPGCSIRRTVGRLIFSRLLGQTITENEEVRDFIYIQDLSEILGKLAKQSSNKLLIKNCCSGKNVSKSSIIRSIVERTPNEKGVLKILKVKNTETFKPSGGWFKKTLRRNPTPLSDGLTKTINSVKNLYFLNSSMSTVERLSALYDGIRQKAEEHGIDQREVEKIKSLFFTNSGGVWVAHEAFWQPTGLVLGHPFPTELKDKLDALRRTILKELGLKPNQYWLPEAENLHTTVISYSHYSESGMNVLPMPDTEVPKAREIVGSYKSLEISFNGALVTDTGSLIVRGFVDNEDLFLLRGDLMSKIRGISQAPQPLVHIKLAQVLDNVPYELTDRVNRLHSSTELGRSVFSTAKTSRGELLHFKP